jgi:hypothetical protein
MSDSGKICLVLFVALSVTTLLSCQENRLVGPAQLPTILNEIAYFSASHEAETIDLFPKGMLVYRSIEELENRVQKKIFMTKSSDELVASKCIIGAVWTLQDERDVLSLTIGLSPFAGWPQDAKLKHYVYGPVYVVPSDSGPWEVNTKGAVFQQEIQKHPPNRLSPKKVHEK